MGPDPPGGRAAGPADERPRTPVRAGARARGRMIRGRIRAGVQSRGRAVRHFVYGIWPYLLLYLILYVVGGTIFFVVELPRYSWGESLYFSVGALAGVTFSDVYPTNGYARIVAGALVLLFVFLLALVVTGFGRRAEEVARQDALGLYGTDLRSHYVVLGSDAIAQVAARDLLEQDLRVALLVERPEDIDRLRVLAPPDRLFLTYGPPTEVETLRRLNLADCRAVIVSMEDDSLSVIVALLVRVHAPSARLIVSANRPELKSTIRRAGVTFVASPFEMGGRICASAAFEPDVAATVDELTTVAVGSELDEYVLPPSAPLVGRTFKEALAEAYARTDAVLIGFARAGGATEAGPVLAPQGDEVLREGDAVLLVVRRGQEERLHAWLGVSQGR